MALREKDKLNDEQTPKHKPQRWKQVKKVRHDSIEEARVTVSGMTMDETKMVKIRKRKSQGQVYFDVVTYRLLAQFEQAQPETAS